MGKKLQSAGSSLDVSSSDMSSSKGDSVQTMNDLSNQTNKNTAMLDDLSGQLTKSKTEYDSLLEELKLQAKEQESKVDRSIAEIRENNKYWTNIILTILAGVVVTMVIFLIQISIDYSKNSYDRYKEFSDQFNKIKQDVSDQQDWINSRFYSKDEVDFRIKTIGGSGGSRTPVIH